MYVFSKHFTILLDIMKARNLKIKKKTYTETFGRILLVQSVIIIDKLCNT